MTSEALQNPYFVRLYCKNIDKTHSLTEPNDKIQFHGNYFFKKGGGEPLWKGGGGTDPLFPPPPKSALDTHLLISLSGNSTVVLMLSVRHYTPTLNKVYLILSYIRGSGAMPPGNFLEILIATGAFRPSTKS